MTSAEQGPPEADALQPGTTAGAPDVDTPGQDEEQPVASGSQASNPELPGAAVVVMGVAGCGKSTVGALLAEQLGGQFLDADDLHTDAARQKMSAGTPLSDDDRWPWLQRVAEALTQMTAAGGPGVIACSALRRSYRQAITAAAGTQVTFLHLHGTADVLNARLNARTDHFMPAGMLDSQLATLEPLDEHERGFIVDIGPAPEEIATTAAQRLAQTGEQRSTD